MNLSNHPCFNPKAHHDFGRVHLPVAPRCNIQCRFCNRRFDCVNESRPGVTSAVLSPAQAMVYLEEVMRQKPNISVVGIAGPGDPFANAAETLETCRLVRDKYPDMMLCLATNGLNLMPHVDEIAGFNVSHVTITINAVDPAIGAKIYAWMRVGKRVMRSEEAAAILLARQLEAVHALKERGIIVKINSIILPGINDDHMAEVARTVGSMGVDLFNCMPYYPNAGSDFEYMTEPPADMVNKIRTAAEQYVPQMRHCTRCRSDAVGLLGEKQSQGVMEALQSCSQLEIFETGAAEMSHRPYVAVASLEGVLVNQHLGEAEQLLIYGRKDGQNSLIEVRSTPKPGGGMARWEELAGILADCRSVLVSGAGDNPQKVLAARGTEVIECEGLIDEAVQAVFAGKNMRHMAVRPLKVCGVACGGNGMGCG